MIRRLLPTLTIALALAACEQTSPSTEPEGGLEAFAEALASQNAALVYDRLAPDTQALCVNALQALRATDDAIQQLQPSDQADARAATGLHILDNVDAPQELFAALLSTQNIPSLNENDGYRVGMTPDNTALVTEDTALVVSRADQEFEMRRGDDGDWRVREPIHSLLEHAVAPIHANQAAVDNAVRLFGEGVEIDDELRQLGLLE